MGERRVRNAKVGSSILLRSTNLHNQGAAGGLIVDLGKLSPTYINPELNVNDNLMLLPADEPANIRLIQIPDDFDRREAYRYVTGLIAQAEEDPDYTWEDILDLLEERGFEAIDFVLGPSLD